MSHATTSNTRSFTRKARRMALLLLVPALLLGPESTPAQWFFRPTQKDLRMLPPYCRVYAIENGQIQSSGSAMDTRKYWTTIFGSDFGHMHHYCQALMLINRSYGELDRARREEMYHSILKEFDYVLSRVGGRFLLMPELYLRQGQVLRKLGRTQEAIRALSRSIAYKQDYALPYAELFDLYQELGLHQRARQILMEGLKHKPDSKKLNRLHKRLATSSSAPEKAKQAPEGQARTR